MEKSEIKGFIAKRVAQELKDGDVVNLGIGLPTLVPAYLPEGVHVILQSENGIIGTGATILGGLEVDEEGSLSNWIIPGKKMPGMGGAMDLLVGAKEVIVAMEHTAKGNPKILKKCRLPYTAVHCITKIITEMCVINVTDKGLELVEINPEFTVEQVQAATEATLIVSPDLKPMC